MSYFILCSFTVRACSYFSTFPEVQARTDALKSRVMSLLANLASKVSRSHLDDPSFIRDAETDAARFEGLVESVDDALENVALSVDRVRNPLATLSALPDVMGSSSK